METIIGTLMNATDWINVVDLNVSAHLPPCIHHGIEFFRTSFLEIPWRLLDHGYVQPHDLIMWYVIPNGALTGVFYFVAPDAPNRSAGEDNTRDGIRHLLDDDASELDAFVPPVNGYVSIDRFIVRMLDQQPWLIYTALLLMIPGYMALHSITKGSVSNRKNRIIRMREFERSDKIQT